MTRRAWLQQKMCIVLASEVLWLFCLPTSLQKRGVNLHAGCQPTRIEPAADGSYVLHYKDSEGKEQSLTGKALRGWQSMCCLGVVQGCLRSCGCRRAS